MGAILKGLQSVLIALGIIAVIGTGIIIYYNAVKPQDEEVAAVEQTGTDMLRMRKSLPLSRLVPIWNRTRRM